MRYQSTQQPSVSADFIEAVFAERALDGGLFLPDIDEITRVQWRPDFAEFAAQLLYPFVDSNLGRAEVLAIARRAFAFPIRWSELFRRRYQLELFHGPSASFKDYSAQFLAQLLAAVPTTKQRLVLLASSGESGAAIAAAFANQPQTQVVITYPKASVSPELAKQLNSKSSNIRAYAVDGSLQDCRAMVERCAAEKCIQSSYDVVNASEVNVIWLLPLLACYAYGSLLSERLHRQPINMIIPAGECENLAAACLVREMGYPIGDIIAAQNSNRCVVDYVATGCFRPKPSIETMVPSMDVAIPANFPRLCALFPSWEEFSNHVQAFSVTDEQIKQAVAECYQETGKVLCPFSAAAYVGLTAYLEDPRPWAIACISHPAKFSQVIEPIIGEAIASPRALRAALYFSTPEICIPADSDLTDMIMGSEQLCIA